MAILVSPAFWASVGALLSAIGLEMIPAQQIAEHVIAAIAGISGLIGIWQSIRSQRAASKAVSKEPP